MSTTMKEEFEKEVYVGSVRLWKSETLKAEPSESEKDTDIGRLWYFFLELVGHGVDSRIERLEVINTDVTATECECGAALEGNECKLTHPCSCKGSGAIITFKSEMAAGTLKKQLSNHKGWHPQGFANGGGRKEPDGSIDFCKQCCFNSKQVKFVNKKPIAGTSHDEDQDEDQFGQANQTKILELIKADASSGDGWL